MDMAVKVCTQNKEHPKLFHTCTNLASTHMQSNSKRKKLNAPVIEWNFIVYRYISGTIVKPINEVLCQSMI